MPLIVIIHGKRASGKTTLAKQYQQEQAGLKFCLFDDVPLSVLEATLPNPDKNYIICAQVRDKVPLHWRKGATFMEAKVGDCGGIEAKKDVSVRIIIRGGTEDTRSARLNLFVKDNPGRKVSMLVHECPWKENCGGGLLGSPPKDATSTWIICAGCDIHDIPKAWLDASVILHA